MIDFSNYPKWADLKVEEAIHWINKVAGIYSTGIRRLAYFFVDDEEIKRINKAYLEHDYTTDIITFGYAEGVRIEGEIYISLDTVRENATSLGICSGEELDRVIIHGLLHLIGYDDQTEEEKQLMRREEDKCLLLRPKILRNK